MVARRFELDLHVFFWLTQVVASRDRQLTAELKSLGLRVPEWRVLASLHARQRLSMRELADLASIDPTTLTRTVDRMQGAGWVARSADSGDQRVTRLAITASGNRLFARVWPVVDRLNLAAVAGVRRGALSELRATLERMMSNLESQPAADRAA